MVRLLWRSPAPCCGSSASTVLASRSDHTFTDVCILSAVVESEYASNVNAVCTFDPLHSRRR